MRSAASPAPTASTQALQRGLAAEHAAVWGYGIVGAHLTGTERTAARADETAHRRRRDAVTATLTAAGIRPVAARPAYRLPFAVRDRAGALRLAVQLETADAAVWYYVLEATTQAATRRTGLQALTGCAERATRWRRRAHPSATATVAFPGR